MSLRRSSFKQPTRPPRVRTPAVPIPPEWRRGVIVPCGAAPAEPQPKRGHIRSPALIKACREIPCQHCGCQDGTVVAAHSNELAHGKGRSVKASDEFVASLCFRCHEDIDQGSRLRKAERQAIWRAAHGRTVSLLLARGLWPLDVPIPDIRNLT